MVWTEQKQKILRRGGKNTQKNCTKKIFTTPMVEPDILECEVKWALGSITMDKANGGDGIPVELFQILKDDVGKVLRSICQQIWKKISSGQRTGKGQFFSSLKERQC